MNRRTQGLLADYDDVWLLDGVRTPFAELNTVLGLVSPIDLGIKAARQVFRRSSVSPNAVRTVVAGSMAQASFDAYMLPRHIGLWTKPLRGKAGTNSLDHYSLLASPPVGLSLPAALLCETMDRLLAAHSISQRSFFP